MLQEDACSACIGFFELRAAAIQFCAFSIAGWDFKIPAAGHSEDSSILEWRLFVNSGAVRDISISAPTPYAAVLAAAVSPGAERLPSALLRREFATIGLSGAMVKYTEAATEVLFPGIGVLDDDKKIEVRRYRIFSRFCQNAGMLKLEDLEAASADSSEIHLQAVALRRGPSLPDLAVPFVVPGHLFVEAIYTVQALGSWNIAAFAARLGGRRLRLIPEVGTTDTRLIYEESSWRQRLLRDGSNNTLRRCGAAFLLGRPTLSVWRRLYPGEVLIGPCADREAAEQVALEVGSTLGFVTFPQGCYFLLEKARDRLSLQTFPAKKRENTREAGVVLPRLKALGPSPLGIRLGNALFLMAAALAMAADFGFSFRMETSMHWFPYAEAGGIFSLLPCVHWYTPARDHPMIGSPSHGGFEEPRLPAGAKAVILHGYFQNLKYFWHHKQLVRSYLLPASLAERARAIFRRWWSAQLVNQEATTLAIHVRLGDRGDGLGVTYFRESVRVATAKIARLQSRAADGNTHCILFSDEPERLRSGRAAQICPKHSIFEEPMRDDLALAVLAVCCSGIVISFSTFSWWAAVLGGYQVVVAPATAEQSCSPAPLAENNTLAYVPGWLRADVPCDAERLGAKRARPSSLGISREGSLCSSAPNLGLGVFEKQRDGSITNVRDTSALKWASVALFASAWRSGRRPAIQPRRAVVEEVALDFLPGTDLPSTAPAPLDNEGAADRVRRMVAADPRNKELETERQEPPFSDEDLREAWHELQLGHADEARSRFVRAVLADPSDAEALFCMGLLYEALHDLRRTVEWMDMAIEVCPDHVFAWETRSRCMEHLGRLAESLAGYEQLEMLDESATGRREGLLGHQRVYILPVGAWKDGAAGYIQKAAKQTPPRPQWQENFLFPEPQPDLRQPALESGIMAWDNVLSKDLLQRLQDCVEDHFQFIFTNRWVYAADDAFEGAASTMWLPSSGDARSVPEVAALTILRHILNQDPAEIAGVEYWARVRSVNLGAGFHYDEAVDADDINSEWVHGNPWRPQWSSVFYLSDEGGPTVVLDQLHDHDGRLAPTLPRKGYLCMPRTNRLVLFRADLHHGSLPLDIWLDSEQTRRVFVFNFWRRHAPEPPHCQRLNFQQHPAMRRHVLTSDEAAALQAVESSRFEDGRDGPSPVRQKVLSRPEELPHSSDFGYLPRPLPMPTIAALTEERLFYEVDWPVSDSNSRLYQIDWLIDCLPPDLGDVARLGSASCQLLGCAATSRVVPLQPWMEADLARLWGGEAELISDSRLAEAALARAAGQVVPNFTAEVATTFNDSAPSAPPVPSRGPLPERRVRQEHSLGPEVRGDWQVLDSASAPQKTVATVSMIDCLWEKVTKVSDDVDSLQEQVQGHSTEINAWIPNHEVARRSELEELSKVCASLRSDCATRRQLEDQATELQGAWRTPMASLSERLGALEAAVKEIPTRLSRESDAAKYALDGLEQRLEQRIQTVVSDRIRTAASEAEVLRDAALERLRAALRQQLQEEAERQEQNASQLKQRFTDRLDDVAAGLRRLEVSLQSETADRLDSAQKELSHLAAEQMRLARAVDENRKLVDACSEDNRRSLESESRRVTEVEARSLSSSSEIQRLGQRLELQSQEFLSRSKEISQHVDEQMQQATQRLQDFGQELKQQACDAASSTKTELLARLKDVQEGEDGQRRSLEERSNALLDRGLQKLAQEVAERMDEGQESQRLASAATEGRLLGQLESYNGRLLAAESWRSAFQEREAAREQRLSSLGEAMRKMEAVCKDVPALESRIDEARAAIKEDLAASAMNAFQGEMRLWAKMAQLGVASACPVLPSQAPSA
ncbi:unnamed protein product [Symbiodinium sp. CCMP2456]|nr:unnamed protein product [Symbiodinium sp. CCMP2456]